MNVPASFRRSFAAGVLLLQWGAPAPAAGAEQGAVPASSAAAASALVPEIRRLIGDAACARTDQCRVVGVGARACGGPEGYWAWSTAGTDERLLEAAVRRQADARRAELERQGMLSTCEVLRPPQAACRMADGANRGHCVLEAGSPAN